MARKGKSSKSGRRLLNSTPPAMIMSDSNMGRRRRSGQDMKKRDDNILSNERAYSDKKNPRMKALC